MSRRVPSISFGDSNAQSRPGLAPTTVSRLHSHFFAVRRREVIPRFFLSECATFPSSFNIVFLSHIPDDMPTLLDKMKLPPFLKSFTVNATSTDQSDDSNKSSVVSKSPKSFSLVSTPVVNKKPVRPNYSATLRTASYLSDHSACTNSSTDTWPALPVHDSMPVRPKLPTFLRSTSYRSDHSCSSRTTSRSRDIEKGIPQLNDCLEPIVSLLVL